jgi:glycine cleavage system H protein
MGSVRGCNVPDDLFYDVESNIWARPENDGTITVGMTSYGCSLAGSIVSFTAKKPGREVKQGRSCGTVESGKWVGPIKAPVAGEIVAVNEAAVADPSLINTAPYGEGWLIRIKPEAWEAQRGALTSGAEALAQFDAKMEADGFGGC